MTKPKKNRLPGYKLQCISRQPSDNAFHYVLRMFPRAKPIMHPKMRDMGCPPDGVQSGYNSEILTVAHKERKYMYHTPYTQISNTSLLVVAATKGNICRPCQTLHSFTVAVKSRFLISPSFLYIFHTLLNLFSF